MSSFSKRPRHEFIDRTIEATNAALQIPEIARHLGPMCATLTEINNNLFVPDIRDGRVVLPYDIHESDRIPILALQPGEAVTMPAYPGGLMPSQHRTMAGVVEELARDTGVQIDAQAVVSYYSGVLEDAETDWPFPALSATAGGKVVGFRQRVTVDESNLGRGKVDCHLVGRPLIALNYAQPGPGAIQAPVPEMIHQGVHAWQYMNVLPLKEVGRDDEVALKLQAYHASGTTAYELLRAHNLLDVDTPRNKAEAEKLIGGFGFTAIQVDFMRSQYNSDSNPFSPHPDLKRFLGEDLD
jgi:hypothetical protein